MPAFSPHEWKTLPHPIFSPSSLQRSLVGGATTYQSVGR